MSIVASGRRLMATTLLDRARIQDRTLVPDGVGGHDEQYLERTKTVSCRFVAPQDGDPILALDTVFGPVEMMLELARGTVVNEGDRVRNLLDESLWQVVKDVTVPSELQIVVRVGIRAVQ